MSDPYLLEIIREQGRQIGHLTVALANAQESQKRMLDVLSLLHERVLLLEAGRAVEEMGQPRVMN